MKLLLSLLAAAFFVSVTLYIDSMTLPAVLEFDIHSLAFVFLPLFVAFVFAQRSMQRVRRRYDRKTSRIIEEKNRLQAQHQALVRLATSGAKQRNLLSFVRDILEQAAHTLDVEHASIWIFEENCHSMRCFDWYEKQSGGHSSGQFLCARSSPRYFEALTQSRVLAVHDLSLSQIRTELPPIHHSLVRALLDAPVRLHGKLHAAVCFRHTGERHHWTGDEQNFAASIADLTALAFQEEEQKVIREELQQKSFAIESSIDGMAILDHNQTYTYVNESHALLYGYEDPRELLGQSWRRLYHDDELERFDRELFPKFQMQGKLQAEAVGRKKDGSTFPQEISLTALADGGLICVVRDISVRKLAERNAEQLALFATLDPAPVMRFDYDGCVISANPSARDIFSLNSAAPVRVDAIIPAAGKLNLQRCIDEGSVVTCASRIGDRYYQFLLRGVRDLRFGHIYGTDITDVKRAQQRLIDSKRFLRRVIDSDPNLIYVKDSQGRFTLANQATASLYGSTVSEILWKTDEELLKTKSEAQRNRAHEQTVIQEHCEHISEEEQFTDAEGRSHLLRTIRRPLQLTPEAEVHVLGVSTDITETKRLQEDLLHSQKMEAIGQLAGGIAHDFNNLLTGILGCTGLLKMKGERDPDVYQGAEMIENAASRAGQLTQKLLGFARKGKHQNIPIDLHVTIEETLALLRRTIEKNIAIVQILRAPHASILGDPTQIQQIILNLAINARDAMNADMGGSDGGELTITTRLVPASEVTDAHSEREVENFLEIVVRDTGCGIPLEVQEKIFEPFFTTKAPGRGTGMGLAMVYGIVQNHDGFIRLRSEPGRGAEFLVYLPSLDPQAVRSIQQPVLQTIPGRGHIMVVDDHNVVRSVTAKMLQSLGYGVVTARDGVEAVDYYREHASDIDLVILDMIMPRMGARECFRILKEINPCIRAVLSTGYVNNNAVQEIMNQGMCAFIQKPYQLNQLSTVVAQALRLRPEGTEEDALAAPPMQSDATALVSPRLPS